MERPGLVQELLSPEGSARARAVEQIAGLGGAELEPLFLELFQDGDALVRTTALKALRKTAGSAANATLAQLLTDPQANVRAQVLREFAEAPHPDIVPILAEYVKTEKDADLVSHAVRALAGVKGAKATAVLVPLAKHESWQVRADVVEILGKRPTIAIGRSDAGGGGGHSRAAGGRGPLRGGEGGGSGPELGHRRGGRAIGAGASRAGAGGGRDEGDGGELRGAGEGSAASSGIHEA